MTWISWHLSPRYGHVTLVSVNPFFIAYHNMDICSQVKHRLQAPILARKFDISDWFPCGADRRAYGHVITKISRMDR